MTNTTQPDTATLIATVEAGLTTGASCCYDIQTEGYGYKEQEEQIEAGRAAFRSLVTDYRRLRSENERLRTLADRVIVLEDMIEECCSLRDVMNYPDGERILNVVRSHVLARALLASMPADGESEEAKK